jgi:hypothetical protein
MRFWLLGNIFPPTIFQKNLDIPDAMTPHDLDGTLLTCTIIPYFPLRLGTSMFFSQAQSEWQNYVGPTPARDPNPFRTVQVRGFSDLGRPNCASQKKRKFKNFQLSSKTVLNAAQLDTDLVCKSYTTHKFTEYVARRL